ncbi:MAG: hypothetical protein HYR94_04665 [Chloroflexi bacterium]|nr:hypothetical protein [Chloroflexota bacterium]
MQIGQQVAVPLTCQKARPGSNRAVSADLPAVPTLSTADLAALKKGSPSLHHNFNWIGAGVAQEPTGWYTFVLVLAGD